MLIKPGASHGAMWLYKTTLDRLESVELSATQLDVDALLTRLCPSGWRFGDFNGQWGLWPEDARKYYTHLLVYQGRYNKMSEVPSDVFSR